MRQANIKMDTQLAGCLMQDDNGYHFKYDKAYLNQAESRPVSLTLPLQEGNNTSNLLCPSPISRFFHSY
jgi:serine/threonine-protein kinase HipA